MMKRYAVILILLPTLLCLGIKCGPGPTPPPVVQVEVCSESILLPNEWCPSTEIRAFEKGKEPTAICAVHKAPDPEPRVRVWVGAYDLLGATGEVLPFLDAVMASKAKGIRLFICWSWNGPQTGGSPYVQVGTWTHDNGITFPLYRLSAWDEAFWAKLDVILRACQARGLAVWLVVEDYCSLKGDSRTKYYNPMICSEEALSSSTPGGVWGMAMRPYHAALIGRTIEAARSVAGLEWIIEPMNEYDAMDWDDAVMIGWHRWAVGEMTARGVDAANIAASPGRNAVAIAGQVGLFSPHGLGRPNEIREYYGISAAKTIWSSDGFFGGTGGCDAKGRCGVGLDVAAALGARVLELGGAGLEILARELYGGNNDRADLGRFGITAQVIAAAAK
jgi:hypothetical protein